MIRNIIFWLFASVRCYQIGTSFMDKEQNENFLVLFQEMYKNILNVLMQHSMHTRGCLFFLAQIHVFYPVTRIKLELKVHYTASLKIILQTYANKKMFTMILLLKFTLLEVQTCRILLTQGRYVKLWKMQYTTIYSSQLVYKFHI